MDELSNRQSNKTSQRRCWRCLVKQMTSTRLGLAANQAWGLAWSRAGSGQCNMFGFAPSRNLQGHCADAGIIQRWPNLHMLPNALTQVGIFTAVQICSFWLLFYLASKIHISVFRHIPKSCTELAKHVFFCFLICTVYICSVFLFNCLEKQLHCSNQLESPSQGCSLHTAVIWLERMTDFLQN